MLNHIVAALAGLLFAVGLGISGATQPSKVVAFLDFFGKWDPSLALTVLSAIALYMPVYRIVLHRGQNTPTPMLHLPTRRDVDLRLLIGAALFGVGWGLSGYSPAPAIVASTTLAPPVGLFTSAMIAGMWLHVVYSRRSALSRDGFTDARSPRMSIDRSRGNIDPAGLVGENLAGANLAGADLARQNLARQNLAGATLAGANLAGANLAGANLEGAHIGVADLKTSGPIGETGKGSLVKIALHRPFPVTMRHRFDGLPHVLNRPFARQVYLNENGRFGIVAANLTGANLIDANLIDANLIDANLEKANLTQANLAGANLERALLNDASLVRASLTDALLEGANLGGANLEGANLEGADLEGANLEGANLEGANLEGANLEGANLEGANLEGANLEGAWIGASDHSGRVQHLFWSWGYPALGLGLLLLYGCDLVRVEVFASSVFLWCAFAFMFRAVTLGHVAVGITLLFDPSGIFLTSTARENSSHER